MESTKEIEYLTKEASDKIIDYILKAKEGYDLKKEYYATWNFEKEVKEGRKSVLKKVSKVVKILRFNFSFDNNEIMILIDYSGDKRYVNINQIKLK
jgi:hypothetical protein